MGCADPRWPSLIAVVERAEREVVVEFGVPLEEIRSVFGWRVDGGVIIYGASVGVSVFDGGSGIPINVGVEDILIFFDEVIFIDLI